MAEIEIQKKEGPPAWIWVVGILALLVLVGVIWALTQGGDDRDRDQDRARGDTIGSYLVEPADFVAPAFVTFSGEPEHA